MVNTDYPTIRISDVEYQARFTLGSLYRLSKRGIRATDVQEGLVSGDVGMVLDVLAVMLGQWRGGEWVPIGMTPEAIADMVEPGALQEIATVLSAAMGKAQSAPTQTDGGQTTPTTIDAGSTSGHSA